MKKKEILIATVAIALMILVGFFYVIHNQVRFDGNRVCTKNPDRFYLNFNLMNADESETMVLNEGEILYVSWQIDGGKADIMIAMADETPIYRADKCVKGENADFELTVPKTGEYTTTISAHHAKGWLEVKRNEDKITTVGLFGSVHPEEFMNEYGMTDEMVEKLFDEFNPDIICGEVRKEDYNNPDSDYHGINICFSFSKSFIRKEPLAL